MNEATGPIAKTADDQAAILWWRLLLSELGTSAVAKSPGADGERATKRVAAVKSLFFRLVQELPVDTMLEIGCRMAETSRHFVRRKPNAKAVAYEANPENYKLCLSDPLPEGMQVVNCAIGARSGEADFYVPDARAPGWGSTRKRLISPVNNPVNVKEIKVPMITLEEAGQTALAEGTGRNGALWIDVEGAALEVLESGQELIRDRISAIYVEVYDSNVYEGSAISLELLRLLVSLGFVPVARDNQFPRAWNLLAVHASSYVAAQASLSTWFYDNVRPPRPAAAAASAAPVR